MNDYLFTFGFMLGSLFDLLVIFVLKRLLFKDQNPHQEEKIRPDLSFNRQNQPQEEKKFQDLSLNIKNLHLNPYQQENLQKMFTERKERIENEKTKQNF